MDALSEILNLPESDRAERGLVHTPAEIAQQPATWGRTFELFRTKQFEIAQFLTDAGLRPPVGLKPTVFLIGAGTSDYIGQSLASLLRKRWSCEALAIPSTDLLTHMDDWLIPERKYLWISFSRSGDSPESVAVLERVRKTGAQVHHVIVSCNAEGRMIRESANHSDVLGICLDEAVNDRGLAMTSSFSNMVIAGQCLAHIEDLSAYKNTFDHLGRASVGLLPRAADAASALAKENIAKACFLGSGPLRGLAKECSLKLLEMTAGKICTMSESVLGLRHGPMAALDQSTMLVCFLSNNPTVRHYELDLLDEIRIKRLVGFTVVLGPAGRMESLSNEDYLILPVPLDCSDDYRAPVDVIFGQLLGLFCSLRHNLRPDAPSPSGAISRVVQKFSMHS